MIRVLLFSVLATISFSSCGFDWYTLKADIDNQTERTMDININNQQIDPFTDIKGTGFFRDGTIELRYSINFDGDIVHFKLVGTKI